MSSFLLTACSKAGLFLANIPAKFSDASVYQDIVYDKNTSQKLDVYVPHNARNAPILIFYYGGRWTDGHKEQYRFVADAFLEEGYIVLIPDYRKYPDVKFPAFVEDTASALAWASEHIAEYGGDPKAIFISGHSSGAHLGALIATDPKYVGKYGLDRDVIKGFVGLSGPYAFVPEEQDLKDMFGPPERYPLMRAPNFVDGKQPPMLLIHGLEDDIVVLENAEKLKNAVADKGGEAMLVTYDNLNHVETIGSLMWFWSSKSDIKEKTLEFLERHRN